MSRSARRCRIVLPCVLGLLASAAAARAAPVAEFRGLGYLPQRPGSSMAHAVSADGLVVVGETGGEAFRWTRAGGMAGLGQLPGGDSYSTALGVTPDGTVVVGAGSSATGTEPAHSEAFRWTALGGIVGLGGLTEDGFDSWAHGVSADGTVVVGRNRYTGAPQDWEEQAFRWTLDDGMSGLGDLPGGANYSRAAAANLDASVIVGSTKTDSATEAFRWTEADGMQSLGVLYDGDVAAVAYAVSADGSVVAGHSDGSAGRIAFRWTAATGMVGLGDLPGGPVDSIATAVSADGAVLVGNGHVASGLLGQRAFLWDGDHGLRDLRDVLATECGLDLAGWVLMSAEGISADGKTIAGWGVNPENDIEAWVAVLPEPVTLALVVVGGLAVLGRRGNVRPGSR